MWFKVTFWSPSWRSLISPLKGSRFHHPKKRSPAELPGMDVSSSRLQGFQPSNSSHLITSHHISSPAVLPVPHSPVPPGNRPRPVKNMKHKEGSKRKCYWWTQLGKNKKQLRYKYKKYKHRDASCFFTLTKIMMVRFKKNGASVPRQTPQRWGTPTVPHPRPCYLLLNVYSHRIHGTGIFTYINGWFLW